jgi:penicillin amidase
VNAALARRVPWELRLLGHRPEPWTPADSVLVARVGGYVSLAQTQGDMERLLVELVQAGVPRAHLDELFPGLLGDLDAELVERVTLGERIVPPEVRWSPALPRAIASNNWVVAGRKTASGHALLANDPHLEVNRLPAVWYEVVLELGPRFCIGATMPGLPGPLLGRTNDLAWGATYTFMDGVDSWVEECRDGAFRRTLEGHDAWVPFRVRTEVIRRKGGADVTVTFHENDHGVLDGDPAAPGLYLATRWASAGTGARSLAAMLGMLHAPDVATGMDILGRIETAWNWVLADRQGSIGYQMSGRMPLRAQGRSGLVPLPGWDPGNDWRGFVEPADLPRALNPACGFIVTANDDLNHLGRAHPINLPMGAHRAERIAGLLAARDDWTVAATRAMQLDVASPHAARFMEVLRPLLPDTRAGRILRDWDLGYDLASEGASLFERFYRALVVEVFGAVCGPDVVRFLVEETPILADFYANFDGVLLRPASVWYGEAGRDAVWRRVAARSVAEPVRPWGEQQRLVMRHLLLGGRLPAWLGFDRGPIALAGGRGTIRQGQSTARPDARRASRRRIASSPTWARRPRTRASRAAVGPALLALVRLGGRELLRRAAAGASGRISPTGGGGAVAHPHGRRGLARPDTRRGRVGTRGHRAPPRRALAERDRRGPPPWASPHAARPALRLHGAGPPGLSGGRGVHRGAPGHGGDRGHRRAQCHARVRPGVPGRARRCGVEGARRPASPGAPRWRARRHPRGRPRPGRCRAARGGQRGAGRSALGGGRAVADRRGSAHRGVAARRERHGRTPGARSSAR